MRSIMVALAALALPALPAAAQPAMVIPPGEQVMVPPRGAPLAARPRPVLPPAGAPQATVTAPMQAAPPALGTITGGIGLTAPALIVPLAAIGAIAAGSLPGSGGGTTAPARTR
ncbi:MAG TPA: hypothetical protein VGN96_02015 [Roseococcus sp.]|jgi:hypothetical protein|nr:hypothetical protein [Roseococcus sp.]